nr:hypothetical protein [uncultured Draconibacterium sp.]
MKLRIKSTKTTIRILGIYQVLGAILGYYVVASILLQTGEINGVLLLFYLIAVGLYSLSFKAGSLLIRKEHKRGLLLSMLNQVFQVFAVGVGAYTYNFISGARIGGGVDFTDGFEMKLDFELTSKFGFAWNSGEEYYMYINLLAIFLIYVFIDIYEELFKKEKPVPEIETEDEIKDKTEIIGDNDYCE